MMHFSNPEVRAAGVHSVVYEANQEAQAHSRIRARVDQQEGGPADVCPTEEASLCTESPSLEDYQED
jgi:hypothetical protein